MRLLPLLLVALALTACGGTSEPAASARPSVAIALDFTPNAVHAPIFAAVRTGEDARQGIRLRIREPGAGPDGLKLVAAGKLDLAVLDIHDLGLARASGLDVVGVAALVDAPLAALVAKADVRRPRDLAGRTVGVSGLPSDPAFLRAIIGADGGDLRRVRQVQIGFNSVPNLISGRVDAAPVFWNAEGVALRERGVRVREFRVERYGAPRYPEVVLVTSRATLERQRDRVVRAVRAIRAGTRATLADPAAAVGDVARAAGGGDEGLVAAQLEAVSPVFSKDGRLDPEVLERWADFDARFGIVRPRPDVGRTFDLTVARR